MSQEVIKFSKPRCIMEPNFWAKFAELKIDKYKLDDKVQIPLWASYALNNHENKSNCLFLDCTSFNENVETTTHNASVACSGFIVNTNTFEAYKEMNLTNFIDTLGGQVVESIKTGLALTEPWRLMMFLIISYSDLKKYKFHYWASYPTPFNLPELHVKKRVPLKSQFSISQIEYLQKQFCELDCKGRTYFCVRVSGDDVEIIKLDRGIEMINSNTDEDIYFAFYDTSSNDTPGWTLRNLMCLLFWHASTYAFEKEIKLCAIRNQDFNKAMIFKLKSKDYPNWEKERQMICEGHLVGWVANDNGKLGPNISDLSETLDPSKLADRSLTLNLKLMKWRLVPELNLQTISSLKCLLLGAGTLGCSVARVLLGWGVFNLTLVDGSTVSHSNTVRQTLYTHQHAVDKRFKAEAAKEALLAIHPNLNVKGVTLNIPMPGHVVGPSMTESTTRSIEILQDLVSEHDVVFLLLDSREARWLPTVLCMAYNKIAINAALGFDSYTVQRFGTRNESNSSPPDLTSQNPSGKDLGCYFCNDVTQPGNSQVDRTLDQQCTVSRPGLSNIAAGLAVELLISVTQHPLRNEARAFMTENQDEERSDADDALFGLLGGIPHTIRGSLWNHETKLTITHRFPSCTACSEPIISEYKERGVDFVLEACNQPNYLERVAGLEDLLKRPDLDELCYETEPDDDDDIS